MTRPVGELDVAYAGVAGTAELLATGRITAADLVDVLLRRIERLQPALNAFRTVFADDSRAAAAVADAARAAGDTRPLLGVPIAVKDNVPVSGHAARNGTGSPEAVAAEDDELVRRLRAAGMIVLGTTHLPELALWAATESEHHGVTRNPWDRSLAPGGSSGGSAAAVAAGLVPAAHATDGLGSIRIPAACCGLVGLKPTHGTVPLGPDIDHWEGLSHAGFLTRSVRDTALLLDAVVEPSPGWAAAAAGTGGSLRVAASTRPATPTRVDPRVRRAFDRAVELVAGLGHTILRADPAYGAVSTASTTRYLAGAAQDVDRLADPSAVERRTAQLAALGRRVPHALVRRARANGDRFGDRMRALFAGVDVLMTPTMPVLPVAAGRILGRGLPATLGLMAPRAAFTAPWNACGFPAVSVPVAWTEPTGTAPDGVPVGVQLVAAPGGEPTLLALAAALEGAAGWTARRPPVD